MSGISRALSLYTSLIVYTGESEAEVTNNKALPRGIVLLKLSAQCREARNISRGLSAIAELLV